MQTEKTSSYSATHKRFYERHREEIRQKRKVSDHEFYERNKERIKARVLARYYANKAMEAALANPPAPGAAESPASGAEVVEA